jgi:hypothetical protein
MPLTQDSRIVLTTNLLSAEVDGEAVIMDMQSGNYFGLDAIGTEIFQLMAQPILVSELCRKLEAEFDATPETIREDVLHLCNEMLQHGLIEVAP